MSSLKIVSLRKQKTMLRILIFLFLSAFSVVLSAQNIDDVDVSRKPDGEYVGQYKGVMVSGKVCKGQKTGTWVENHANSELPHFIIQYAGNVRDGLFIELDRQGNLLSKAEYKSGLLEGKCMRFKLSVMTESVCHSSGVKHGPSVICYDKGTKMEDATYKDGKRDGLTLWYYNNGKEQGGRIAAYNYKDGLFDGIQETYFENGVVSSRKYFKNNVQEGRSLQFYDDGSLKSMAEYKDGVMVGEETLYEKGASPH